MKQSARNFKLAGSIFIAFTVVRKTFHQVLYQVSIDKKEVYCICMYKINKIFFTCIPCRLTTAVYKSGRLLSVVLLDSSS